MVVVLAKESVMHRSKNVERGCSYKNNKKGEVKGLSALWFEDFVKLKGLWKLHQTAASEGAFSDSCIFILLSYHITLLYCHNTISSLSKNIRLHNEGILCIVTLSHTYENNTLFS